MVRVLPKKRKRSIGLRETQPIGIDVPEMPPVPPYSKIALGWGAAYKVGDDIPAGSTIHVDYSDVDGIVGLAAAVQEIQGLDFDTGGPSDEPWADPPFNGSIASSGTVDSNRDFHVTLESILGHDFRTAGWKGMQVVTRRYPNAFDWAGQDPWFGTEYHKDGSIIGEGGMDLFSHMGWKFIDQFAGTTDIHVYIELVNTSTGEQFAYGLCDIRTTGDLVISDTFDRKIKFPAKEVDVTLSHDIIAPSGLAIVTMMIVDDSFPTASGHDNDVANWPIVSDSTESVNNFAKGRVLSAALIDIP